MKRIFYYLSVFFIALILAGCEEENTEEVLPVSCFETPDSLFVGLAAEFSASCSENATDYIWSFGDGSSGSDSVVSHAFSEAGNYEITLVVSNENGTDELTQEVKVYGNKVVHVTGNINSDVTWQKDSVYVIAGDMEVNAILTIEPGTVVKFREGTFMNCQEGKIIARGTSQLPIVFTSIRDDLHGGDVNDDGDASVPEKGDWDFIAICGTNNTSEFNYCEFYYGGGYTDFMDYTLNLESANTSVTHCTFAHNEGEDQGALCAGAAMENVTIENNIFYGNTLPLTINGNLDIDDSNVFHNPSNTAEDNTHNGIYIYNLAVGITGTRNWGETEVPFVLYNEDGADLRIEAGNTLTLAPGVTVKIYEHMSFYLEDGLILAQGTADNRIVFTSYHDDAHGGDTDANGSNIVPMAGDWDYIQVCGTNNQSKFEYCGFYYGGGYSDYQDHTLQILSNNTLIDHCIFANNKGNSRGALNLEEASGGTKVTNNIFYGNVKPMSIGGMVDIDNSNVFHNPSDPSETNNKNGIFMLGTYGRIKGDRSWEETEVPFVVGNVDYDQDLYIEDGNSLSLANGVIIKFKGDALQYNGSNLHGHDQSDVWFTSFYDDTRGGDTDGNGSTHSPASGDWQGVYNMTSHDYENWSNILYSGNE